MSKLFHVVRPHVAVFGEKDFQQLAVIRRMARDLDFGIDVVGAPTVREADRLAMSSRNARLSIAARDGARCVPTALDAARLAVADGAREIAEVHAALAQVLADEPRAKLEYAVICDPDSLEPVGRIDGPVQLVVAVWVDGVRLIDNVRIDPGEVDPPAWSRPARDARAAAARRSHRPRTRPLLAKNAREEDVMPDTLFANTAGALRSRCGSSLRGKIHRATVTEASLATRARSPSTRISWTRWTCSSSKPFTSGT